MKQRWNDFNKELEEQCEFCDTWYPVYDGYPWPGLCPQRYLIKHFYDEMDELVGLA